MTPYAMLGSNIGTHEAASLSSRLSAWHDAMVAHERRLRAGRTDDTCGDECPHADARTLWSEALQAFGERAQELTFLRSRAADDSRRYRSVDVHPPAYAQAADAPARRRRAPAASRHHA